MMAKKFKTLTRLLLIAILGFFSFPGSAYAFLVTRFCVMQNVDSTANTVTVCDNTACKKMGSKATFDVFKALSPETVKIEKAGRFCFVLPCSPIKSANLTTFMIYRSKAIHAGRID
jgi:hypothetical protein